VPELVPGLVMPAIVSRPHLPKPALLTSMMTLAALTLSVL
jgi:hypothetical protein